MHLVPTSASRLNQVERFFGLIASGVAYSRVSPSSKVQFKTISIITTPIKSLRLDQIRYRHSVTTLGLRRASAILKALPGMHFSCLLRKSAAKYTLVSRDGSPCRRVGRLTEYLCSQQGRIGIGRARGAYDKALRTRVIGRAQLQPL